MQEKIKGKMAERSSRLDPVKSLCATGNHPLFSKTLPLNILIEDINGNEISDKLLILLLK